MVKPSRGPYCLHFQNIGIAETGFIGVAEFEKTIPFDVKRAFWVYQTPSTETRGNHAHHETELVLIAVSGTIIVSTETPQGEIDSFILSDPKTGVYLPPHVWRTMQYSPDALQLVFASAAYKDSDYIKDYGQFKSIGQQLT